MSETSIKVTDVLDPAKLLDLNVGDLCEWMIENKCPSINVKIGEGENGMFMAFGVGTYVERENALAALSSVTDEAKRRMESEAQSND